MGEHAQPAPKGSEGKQSLGGNGAEVAQPAQIPRFDGSLAGMQHVLGKRVLSQMLRGTPQSPPAETPSLAKECNCGRSWPRCEENYGSLQRMRKSGLELEDRVDPHDRNWHTRNQKLREAIGKKKRKSAAP